MLNALDRYDVIASRMSWQQLFVKLGHLAAAQLVTLTASLSSSSLVAAQQAY
jgi:hypothetical protein